MTGADLIPMHDRVLVKRIPEPVKGLIVLVDNETDPLKPKQVRGEVVRVGPGKWIEGVNGNMVRAPLDVKPGEIVYFGRFTDWDGNDYALIQEADIIGVEQPESAAERCA